jgi:hypothetical protein
VAVKRYPLGTLSLFSKNPFLTFVVTLLSLVCASRSTMLPSCSMMVARRWVALFLDESLCGRRIRHPVRGREDLRDETLVTNDCLDIAVS